MKIAIISHLKFPIKQPYQGGLEMHTQQLVQGLQQRGHIVHLYAATGSDPSLGLQDCSVFDLDYNQQLTPEPNYDYFAEQFIQEHHAYLDILSKIREGDYDIVHNNSLNYLPITLNHFSDLPAVTVLHTPPFSWIQSAVKHESRYGQMRYLTVSKENAGSWERYKTELDIVHNGVNINQWGFSDTPDKSSVVWFGRITPEKGTHLALKAIHAAGMNAVVAGSIHNQEYFENEVKPLLKPTDTYLGHLTHAQLSETIGRASVFCCTPMWDEPFGLVVIEALACGTPVAAFNRGAMKEILTTEVGSLALPGDVDSLATAIQESAKKDRRLCRAHVQTNFSLDAMLNRYEEIYKEEIEKRSSKKLQVLWQKAG